MTYLLNPTDTNLHAKLQHEFQFLFLEDDYNLFRRINGYEASYDAQLSFDSCFYKSKASKTKMQNHLLYKNSALNLETRGMFEFN